MLEAEKASETGGSEKKAMKVAWHKGNSEEAGEELCLDVSVDSNSRPDTQPGGDGKDQGSRKGF